MFSPDGKVLLTTQAPIKVWSTSSWTLQQELRFGPQEGFEGLLFSPDSKLLLTHGKGHVKIWNTGTWTVEGEFIVSDSSLTAAAFAPDSKTVMIADADGILHHWSLATQSQIRTLRTFDLHKINNAPDFAVSDLQFSPDGGTLIATTYLANKPVLLWNTNDWLPETETGFNSAAFSKDGKLLALGGKGRIKLIDPASRKQLRDFELLEMTRAEIRTMRTIPMPTRKSPAPSQLLPSLPMATPLPLGADTRTEPSAS